MAEVLVQVDYRQPYCRGTSDPLKTALEGTAFNNRKLSGVFVAGRQSTTTHLCAAVSSLSLQPKH